MSGETIRIKFMRRFVGLDKYSRSFARFIVATYILQIIFGIGLGHYLLTFPVSALSVLLMVLVSVFVGTRLRGLNNIVHECSHASFAEDRKDNVALGCLCASMVFGCFRDYRDEHLSHHSHLGDYDRDMDLQGIKALRIHEALTATVILRHLTNPLWGRHLPYYFSLNLGDRDGAFFQWFKASLVIGLVGFTLVDPLTATFFVLVPYVLIYTTINYWTDCLDHAGIVGSDDELDASRNVLAPLALRLLFFPRNDCYHLVHHLFPQIPARHLDAAHQELSRDPEYQSAPTAVRPFHHSVTGLKANIS